MIFGAVPVTLAISTPHVVRVRTVVWYYSQHSYISTVRQCNLHQYLACLCLLLCVMIAISLALLCSLSLFWSCLDFSYECMRCTVSEHGSLESLIAHCNDIDLNGVYITMKTLLRLRIDVDLL